MLLLSGSLRSPASARGEDLSVKTARRHPASLYQSSKPRGLVQKSRSPSAEKSSKLRGQAASAPGQSDREGPAMPLKEFLGEFRTRSENPLPERSGQSRWELGMRAQRPRESAPGKDRFATPHRGFPAGRRRSGETTRSRCRLLSPAGRMGSLGIRQAKEPSSMGGIEHSGKRRSPNETHRESKDTQEDEFARGMEAGQQRVEACGKLAGNAQEQPPGINRERTSIPGHSGRMSHFPRALKGPADPTNPTPGSRCQLALGKLELPIYFSDSPNAVKAPNSRVSRRDLLTNSILQFANDLRSN